MNKTYQELCDEVVLLREQLQAAQQQAADYRQTLEQMEAEEGQEIPDLKEQLDTAHMTVIQVTASAVNWRNRCKELEAHNEQPAACPACDSQPGQYHAPECPAVDAFTAGRIAIEDQGSAENQEGA